MKQFNLSEWLEDKSRKVVTRRGNPVRIICIDRKHGKDELPIVFLEENNGGEFLLTCRNDGRCDNYDTQYDLFFADEELTEFEKAIQNILNEPHYQDIQAVKQWSKTLLDLAIKEGILKDSPKWKTYKGKLIGNGLIFEDNVNLVLVRNGYYIDINKLEKLPKEE